jgi:small subunit ribosomal protein S20
MGAGLFLTKPRRRRFGLLSGGRGRFGSQTGPWGVLNPARLCVFRVWNHTLQNGDASCMEGRYFITGGFPLAGKSSSAEKRHRQSEERRLRNKAVKSAVRTSVKKFVALARQKDAAASEAALRDMIKKIDTARHSGTAAVACRVRHLGQPHRLAERQRRPSIPTASLRHRRRCRQCPTSNAEFRSARREDRRKEGHMKDGFSIPLCCSQTRLLVPHSDQNDSQNLV